MKETRKLYSGDLRMLCIRENWYTKGTNEEYAMLLNIPNENENIDTETIIDIAEDILAHSHTEYDLPSICFGIAEICHSFFE